MNEPQEPQRNLMNFIISPEERDWLERMVELDGGGGKSAYIRRLIRQEARRLGLAPTAAVVHPDQTPLLTEVLA